MDKVITSILLLASGFVVGHWIFPTIKYDTQIKDCKITLEKTGDEDCDRVVETIKSQRRQLACAKVGGKYEIKYGSWQNNYFCEVLGEKLEWSDLEGGFVKVFN